MTVMEHAKALGEAIADDKVVKELREAQEAYNNCRPLQDKMTEYNANRAAMGEEFKKEIEKQDPEMINMIRNRMDALGKEIVSFPEYKRMADAEAAMKALMTRINGEINFYVFGVRPEENENACTHDCSSCSGCH